MQSEPVSPPPMTTTCLPPARIGALASCGSPLTRRFCCGRNSMAKWMPSSSRPGIGRSRAFSAPPASTTRIEVLEQILGRQIDADMGAVMERDAFHIHLRHAAIDVMLLHLEVGNAVAKQAAGLGVFLEHVHVVAGARELLRAGHAGGTRADDRDFLSGLDRGRLGLDPALLEGAVGDRAFDRLDGHRIVVDVERAGGLARRRTDAAGDLREIIGGVQVARGFLPVAAIDAGRSSPGSGCSPDSRCGNRECRNPCSARPACVFSSSGQREDEFAPMLDALLDRLVVTVAALELEKAGDLAHTLSRPPAWCAPSSISASARRYSSGITLRNFGQYFFQSARICAARAEPVSRACRVIRRCSRSAS